MDEKEAARYWNDNAKAWTILARDGRDTYRDHLNTPALFDILPDVKDLSGIDIGCGEGHNTRVLRQRGAKMKAIDTSEHFIGKAKEVSDDIGYQVASATALPFQDAYFDFATSFMCLMDVPEPAKALREAYRVLKPGGFLQFSITHPCYATPHRKNLRNAEGKTYAVEIGGYFENLNGRIEEWTFSEVPPGAGLPKFKVPIFNFTLTEWFDMILGAGFVIEKINEPRPDDAAVNIRSYLQDAQVVAYFLHIRCRK